jgi:hypothetical protein
MRAYKLARPEFSSPVSFVRKVFCGSANRHRDRLIAHPLFMSSSWQRENPWRAMAPQTWLTLLQATRHEANRSHPFVWHPGHRRCPFHEPTPLVPEHQPNATTQSHHSRPRNHGTGSTTAIATHHNRPAPIAALVPVPFSKPTICTATQAIAAHFQPREMGAGTLTRLFCRLSLRESSAGPRAKE